MRRLLFILLLLAVLVPIALIVNADRQRAKGERELDQQWQQTSVAGIGEFGSTPTLKILPLVNWHASANDFRTEPGVSYLIRTDNETILFDLGYNRFDEAPSPLEHNMALAGIAVSDIDTIFISHGHRDHVGGTEWARTGTFSFGQTQVSLDGKSVYAPIPLTYPGVTVETIDRPTALSSGVASTGPIPRELFIGRIDEQALVLNLEGKGLVVIVGCGHQTVPKLLQRIEDAFDEPLYAIIGDLHYPVPEGRWKVVHIDVQRQLASGKGIFAPIDQETVDREIKLLSDRLGFLAVGGHDTSNAVIRAFGEEMGDRFAPVEVGVWITLPRDSDRVRHERG